MKEILGNILDGADGESEGLDGVDGESKEMEDYEDDDGFVVQIYEDWEENEEQIVVEPDHNLSLISTINIENDSDSAEYAEPDLQTSQHSNNYQNKTLLCEVCNKMFSKRSYYTRHIKIHLGIRRYQCSSCDKSFCSQQNLTIHNRVHTGERPYECVLCAKSFAVQQNLSIHLRSHTGML